MSELKDEMHSIIEASMAYHPRSLQKRIGPSQLGTDCMRCLTHWLAGDEERQDLAWLPWIGTSVHERLELLMVENNNVRVSLGMPWRWITEATVTVGTVGGTEITGSTDLFDPETGTVLDYKCVGTTTLRKARAHGPSQQYRTQAALYSLGWTAQGYEVKKNVIWFLPRNSISLRDGYWWEAPPDVQAAREALDRANRIHDALSQLGHAAVLDSQPEHTGDLSCKKWTDYAPPLPADPSADPFG